MTDTGEKPESQCGQCSKSFKDLKAHILSCHSDKTIKCTMCSKLFSQSRRMKQHIRLVHQVPPKNCKQCKKSFKDLEAHLLSFHIDKTQKCTMCDKYFGTAKGLREHMT